MASDSLIDTIIAEAGGEGPEGITAATWAIAQRAAARGETMDEVIKSGFDGYSNPGSGAVKAQGNSSLRQMVEQVINGVQQGTIPNPVPGADHFLSGDVMPSWARNMTPVATIGGHRFYASGQVPTSAQGKPVPPGEIPSVASLLDVRRQAPTPAVSTPTTAAIRQMTSPTGGNSDLQSALNTYATRERNRVTPASAEERVTARNRQFFSQPAAPATAMPLGGKQSYAGQERASKMPILSSVSGTNNAARRAVLSMGGNQTYAGQDRSPLAAQPSASDRVRGNEAQTRNVATTIATIPTRQTTASDRVRGNELQTRNLATTVASIPTRAPVSASDMARGKQPAGPTTRVVPTTRVGNSANNIAAQRNEQLATRAPAVARNPVTVPGPASAPKTAERLAPTIGLAMNPTATRAPVQSGGLSRDALARQAAYTATMINPPARTPPVVTPPRVQQPLPVLQAPAPVQRVAPVPQMRPVPQPQPQPQPRPQPQRIAPVPFNRPPLLAASAPPAVARAPLMAGAMLPAMPAQQVPVLPPQIPPAPRVWMTGFTGAGTSGGAHGGSADNQDNWTQGRR